MISNAIECSDEFRPQTVYIKINGKKTLVYLLGSTPRFTYGACVEELIKYRGALTFIYSPHKKSLYRIELFIPKKEFNKKEVLTILSSFNLQKHSRVKHKKRMRTKATRTKAIPMRTNWSSFKDYNLII